MAKRILVLGGGRQGRVIAEDLGKDHDVTVADSRPLTGISGVKTLVADLSHFDELCFHMASYDLIVGALPAALGYEAAQAAIAAQRSYVDIAFYEEDAADLHDKAKAAGVAIMPDCGLAPGISNLVIGRAMAQNPEVERIDIYVGGVAADKTRPFGYVISWSVPDLLEEYVRPARIRQNGETVSVPVFSGMEQLDIEGVGTMEAFYTDGLRSLLDIKGPKTLNEKTLRWPGHVDAIKPLLEKGSFIEEISAQCSEGEDFVVLFIRVDGEEVVMTAQAKDGLSAMSRTTALTCAAFARLVAAGGVKEVGVVPPEIVGRNAEAYGNILDQLKGHGILLNPERPFI
ncbi:MAG: saccharopine dehydrogenase C-terminal domain-containing protein [Planctomycetota bacterium]|nr:saccharopine dehydrogenase C-terminal domain-containing protein [Planctomycetota bacterium]